MKLITAIIQPHKLQAVEDSLFKIGISGMTISNVLGCGQQYGYPTSHRGAVHEVNMLHKIRIEIAANDNCIEEIMDAIVDGAYTGHIGDGKIFVSPLFEAVRIRTREKGKAALAKSAVHMPVLA
jgi:nitrogen regulatory protein P-II 2